MSNQARRLFVLTSVVPVVALITLPCAFFSVNRDNTSLVRQKVASLVPVGTPAEKLFKQLGRPLRSRHHKAVLMNSVTMLSPKNSLAPRYGMPEEYLYATYDIDWNSVTFAIDQSGKVACRMVH